MNTHGILALVLLLGGCFPELSYRLSANYAFARRLQSSSQEHRRLERRKNPTTEANQDTSNDFVVPAFERQYSTPVTPKEIDALRDAGESTQNPQRSEPATSESPSHLFKTKGSGFFNRSHSVPTDLVSLRHFNTRRGRRASEPSLAAILRSTTTTTTTTIPKDREVDPRILPAVNPDGKSQAWVTLFEWTWADIAIECEEWLGPKGFTAVQVSPPQESVEGDQWYTRYQAVSYKIHSRSGNEDEFKAMVKRCTAAGVGVYVDVILNHATRDTGVGTDGSHYANRNTMKYAPENFHHSNESVFENCVVVNCQKDVMQKCDLSGLWDLDTSQAYVQETLASYLNHLLDLGVAGFRVDAAGHIDASEMDQLFARVARGRFVVLEVISASKRDSVHSAQYYDMPNLNQPQCRTYEFPYGLRMKRDFEADGHIQYLAELETDGSMAVPSDKAGTFIDNHDTQRNDHVFFEPFLSYESGVLHILATIYMLAHPYGYPNVFSGYFFSSFEVGPPHTPVHAEDGLDCGVGHGWVCEHRLPQIANMVAWRRFAGAADLTPLVTDHNWLAFCRGDAACVAMNRGADAWQVDLIVDLPPGRYCDVIRSDDPTNCPGVEVKDGGRVSLHVPAWGAIAFHVGAANYFPKLGRESSVSPDALEA